MSRDQIQALHNTKSTRNTNIIMQRLKPYTRHIRLNQNAYYLNKKGAALVGCDYQLKSNDQITHKLMRNDAYIYFMPEKWSVEQELKYKNIVIRPDAYFYKGEYRFLEVDNTQKWNVNVDKIREYNKLKQTGAFQKQIGYFPLVVWIIAHESRRNRIEKEMDRRDLTCKVYLHDEIKI